MARSAEFLKRLQEGVNKDKLNAAVEIWGMKNMYSNGNSNGSSSGGASTSIGGIYDNPRAEENSKPNIEL